QSFLLAYICGVIFWGFTVYWLVHVTLLGTVILILYLALYFGAFGALFTASDRDLGAAGLFFIPCTWVLLEYGRSHLFTGFPWALIGFSQYKNLPVIQIADLTGAWGVSFLVIFFNVAFYLIWRGKMKLRISFICAAILILSFSYGFYKLNRGGACRTDKGAVKIAVIQGNIPQHLKWDVSARNFILNRYKELTLESAGDKPELIIWPEASVPGILGEDDAVFEQVFSLAGSLNTDILAGAVSHSGANYFNSALFIDKSGRPLKAYHKLHLVPFGEFIPFKETFPFLQTIAPIGDIQPGKEYTIFDRPAKFGVLICFEDLFPELSRRFVKEGAGFLVNITNDAWYKETSAAAQHFSASVFRAVENRVYLARAANTGISGFIDPLGRIVSPVRDTAGKDIFVRGFSTAEICLAEGRSFYNRYGDIFVIFCFLFDACVIIWFLKSKNSSRA
ncbi:MAG: apolipoprotein N-acyltransferase, partial [Candidatus Omnitrophica bacterium]|nr:apolipoprotein N-acyltransferase [Candidatus Omnitrophota bacterium]